MCKECRSTTNQATLLAYNVSAGDVSNKIHIKSSKISLLELNLHVSTWI